MIKEVIVVEGKKDIEAVRRAVDAECLATGGYGLLPYRMMQIEAAYQKRGIIILTDPDSAGERIRSYLNKRFPLAKHAFIPREAATANDDVGVEQAPAEAIRAALSKARCQEWNTQNVFTWDDLINNGLSGAKDSSARRAALGAVLGIGYTNAKTFLRRLNQYGITYEEFTGALAKLEDK